MAIVLVTGGTGLTGKALSEQLTGKGYDVIILTRNPGKNQVTLPRLSYAKWDPARNIVPTEAIGKADHIIHLAGEGIADKRWTKKRKQQIIDSRIEGSRLLAESLHRIPNQVKTVITASAIGWYGPGPSDPIKGKFVETDPPAGDFLGETCRQWEAAIEPAKELGKRIIKFRTGIIISPFGGAMAAFRKPLRFGIAAIMGNGRQVTSWIHIDDLVAMYIRAIEDEKMEGVYNAVAPEPTTNNELIMAIARGEKNFFIPVHIPAFLLKIILGEMSIEVLKTAVVSSKKIQETGFVFKYPVIEAAVKQVCKRDDLEIW